MAWMEDKYDWGEKIWILMRHWLGGIAEGMKRSSNKNSMVMLDDLHLQTTIVNTPIPRKVKWEKLVEGWLKLNVDGSCRGNPGSSGGGRIIQD